MPLASQLVSKINLRCGWPWLLVQLLFVTNYMVDEVMKLFGCRRVLEDQRENPMVRHEAAEALGSIADERCLQLLKQYCADASPIVAHSCEVALDMLDFETSQGFEYADIGAEAVQPEVLCV